MKKHIGIVLALVLCTGFIMAFASCGAQKLESTEQYKAIAEISASWTEQTSFGTVMAAKLASETIPGVLYGFVDFTGDKSTIAEAYSAWQAEFDQYYDDTLIGFYGQPLNPDAYANAVDPGEFDDINPRTLLSTEWTMNEDLTIPSEVAAAVETAVFDATAYATAFEEPVHKKDIDVTVGSVRYAGFILVEPDYNLYGPDTISVTVALAYIPSAESTIKATKKATTEATTRATTKPIVTEIVTKAITTEATTKMITAGAADKTTTKKQGPAVVDTWDSSIDVYSLLDDGSILRGKTPIKNDASEPLNKAWQVYVNWSNSDDDEVPDELLALVGDSTAVLIFTGELNRDDAPQYIENIQNGFLNRIQGLES